MHKLKIIYEDEVVIVIDKEAGVLSLPDRFNDDLSVFSLMRRQYPDATLCHRIDRDTSGIVLAVKDKVHLPKIAQQFENRQIEKSYLAIVDGIPPSEGRIDLPIIESTSKRGKMMTAKKGMDSLTTYTTLETFGKFALVQVGLHTGRQHQIRVHMAAIGHPLMVDSLYGKRNAFLLSEIKRKYRKSGDIERPLIQRHTLHAKSLRFEHPGLQKPLHFEAELPKDMRAVLNQLKKNAR